jgi:hypothetical protein
VWAAPFNDALIGPFSGSPIWGMAIALGWIGVACWMIVMYRPREAI